MKQAVGSGKFGLTLQTLTADSASKSGLEPGDQGLLVTRVNSAGTAANAGIKPGDLIQEVNRKSVRTLADFSAAIQQSGTRPALLLIKRARPDCVRYTPPRAVSRTASDSQSWHRSLLRVLCHFLSRALECGAPAPFGKATTALLKPLQERESFIL